MQIQKVEERCDTCGLCVKDCVAGVWREIDGRPEMAAPQYCNQCGHCVAVCPNGAIVHAALDSEQIRKLEKKLLDPDVYRETIRSRRSIRRYRRKAVSKEVIDDILELAGHSPTASNLQNVAYTVINDQAILNVISTTVFGFGAKIYLKTRKGIGKLFYLLLKFFMRGDDLERYVEPMGYYIEQTAQGRDFILHGAPVLILVHGPKKGSFHSENCNIAAANMMNYAHACGLGTCYIGFLVLMLKLSKRLRKIIRLPKNRRVYACLILGYPAYKHSFTTSRRKRPVQWL